MIRAEDLPEVRVMWIDSKGLTPEWEHKDDMEDLKPVVIMSTGILIDENSADEKEGYITLALSVSSGQVLGRLTIPKKCILSATPLYHSPVDDGGVMFNLENSHLTLSEQYELIKPRPEEK